MDTARRSSSSMSGTHEDSLAARKPSRPCDTCRRRKSKCVMNPSSISCVLCSFHKQSCTFSDTTQPRTKRRATGELKSPPRKKVAGPQNLTSKGLSRSHAIAEDYANLQGPSLLKTTLGLQNHRYATYVGPTSEQERILLLLRNYDYERGENRFDDESYRKVDADVYFRQLADVDSPDYARELQLLDMIESAVSPCGDALIKLYFRIVHPSFPILHKKVYLEKYARSHREFIPPLLAAVYILALDWWDYSIELAERTKPDAKKLEKLALESFDLSAKRPKLSTVQAGLLLLQRTKQRSLWQLTSQVVAISQDLGLHQNCSYWQIPAWEIGLRKRLAWAVYMQSCWSAMVCGRPQHFPPDSRDWSVQGVTSEDFPENAADEDDEEGSTEVEMGRIMFCSMIELTRILAKILYEIHSASGESSTALSSERTKFVLAKIKDLQLELRQWYNDIHPNLALTGVATIGKLSSNGWLHTSYFATEMTLHRAVVRTIDAATDPFIAQICMNAARERLEGAIQVFNQLRPEHFHSFWYFASSFNFTLIGLFATLCMVVTTSTEEQTWFQKQLQTYRWRLRVSSKNIEFLENAVRSLDQSIGPVLKAYIGGNGRSPGNTASTTSPLSTHMIETDYTELGPFDQYKPVTTDQYLDLDQYQDTTWQL